MKKNITSFIEPFINIVFSEILEQDVERQDYLEVRLSESC